jgi:predicted RNase H-like HicB family nuclease
LKLVRYYSAIVETASECYGLFFQDVLGCTSAGTTVLEAARNAEEALQAHLDLTAEHGEIIPVPSELDAIVAEPSVVEAARVLVRAEVSGRSVRVNITLPEELLAAVDRYAARSGYGVRTIGAGGARADAARS